MNVKVVSSKEFAVHRELYDLPIAAEDLTADEIVTVDSQDGRVYMALTTQSMHGMIERAASAGESVLVIVSNTGQEMMVAVIERDSR